MMRRMALPVAAALALLAAGPAWAADELGVSRDGTTWTADLTDPLFAPSLRWVPGDHQQSSFLARNQSDDPATLEVSVEGTSVHSLLETGDFHVSARGGSGSWMTVSEPGTHTIVQSTRLAPGREERITVAIDFDPQSPNLSERKRLDLRLEVRLTQRSGQAQGGSGLPGTGGPYLAILVVATALTAVGAAASIRHRRRVDG
jgi:hypothetical protein